MEPETAAAIPLFAATTLAIFLTLGWIGVHIFGLIRLAPQLDAVSQRTKIAWGVSAIGGFMGPCVIVAALVGMGLAIAERRAAEATDATRQATGIILLAGTLILVMTATLVAGALVSMALG